MLFPSLPVNCRDYDSILPRTHVIPFTYDVQAFKRELAKVEANGRVHEGCKMDSECMLTTANVEYKILPQCNSKSKCDAPLVCACRPRGRLQRPAPCLHYAMEIHCSGHHSCW
jgi:hypothetical protein